MILERPSSLASYAQELLSRGRIVFSREDAMQALGVSHGAFLDAAERLQRRRHLISPRRGFYVVVPPQFLNWGAPPPPWYIDDLMRHAGQPYYVALLKAAELHGASHQAVMEFQVVTDKQMPPTKAGRSVIAYYYRKDMDAVSAGIEERKTDTGRMHVSSPELTALDLIRYPRAGGGLDNIATVLNELGERLDAGRLADLAAAFERSVLQRLGYLLERVGRPNVAAGLHEQVSDTASWVELDPAEAADPDFAPEPVERNRRWHVIARRTPEVDE
ncbi:putative transcriptional regulator of viral defense system [Azospirillum fermentarium]|uniref:type IV toxin-antitoxin system AbiEi family antitoxin domain-containing protein n=1 Tax=Azospirillum fermentarium TaxID=1233114 RepID=UPI002226406E|nr:type IV toxin-antitoxin system AbiEi family antitoxin [Azospirillum fermentarium]MCW2249258.1 putative transcriptional regulator of viral defense system [Azospirillum fermentarium]